MANEMKAACVKREKYQGVFDQIDARMHKTSSCIFFASKFLGGQKHVCIVLALVYRNRAQVSEPAGSMRINM